MPNDVPTDVSNNGQQTGLQAPKQKVKSTSDGLQDPLQQHTLGVSKIRPVQGVNNDPGANPGANDPQHTQEKEVHSDEQDGVTDVQGDGVLSGKDGVGQKDPGQPNGDPNGQPNGDPNGQPNSVNPDAQNGVVQSSDQLQSSSDKTLVQGSGDPMADNIANQGNQSPDPNLAGQLAPQQPKIDEEQGQKQIPDSTVPDTLTVDTGVNTDPGQTKEVPGAPLLAQVVLGDVSLEANGIDSSKLPPEGVSELTGMLIGMRERDAQLAQEFFAARAAETATLAGLSAEVEARIAAAEAAALAQVRAASAAQLAALKAGAAAARSQAQAAAAGMVATVDTQSAATLAHVQSTLQATKGKLEGERTKATGQVDAAATAQKASVEKMYAAADKRYRGAGEKVGQEAAAAANKRAAVYEGRKINRMDSLLEGYYTDNKCEARAKAAREVGAAYKKGLIEEANKQATAAGAGKARDLQAVDAAAKTARDQIAKYHAGMLAQAQKSADASKTSAEQAAKSLKKSIQKASKSAVDGLNSHEAAQVAAITAASAQAEAGITAQAGRARGGLTGAIARVTEQINAAMAGIAAQLGGAEIPDPEAFAASLQASGAQFTAQLELAKGMLRLGADSAVVGIGQLASGAVAGLISAGAGAVAAATSAGAAAKQQIGALAPQVQKTFKDIKTAQDKGMAATLKSAQDGHAKTVDGVKKGYDFVQKQLTQGMEGNVNALMTGLRGALPKMDSKISTEAEAAAAKVQPAWKSVLKFVCILVIAIAIAVVLGPLVVGAVAGVMGAGLGATLVGGAIVGAISGAATTMFTNAFDGNPLFEGVGMAMLTGAAGGLLGAGAGVLANNLATKGGQVVLSGLQNYALNVATDVVVDNTINLVTGQLSWESFGQGLITSLVTNGVKAHPRVEARIKYYESVGQEFGTGLRGKITGVGNISDGGGGTQQQEGGHKTEAEDGGRKSNKVEESENQTAKVEESESQQPKVEEPESQKAKVEEPESQKAKVEETENQKAKVDDPEVQKGKTGPEEDGALLEAAKKGKVEEGPVEDGTAKKPAVREIPPEVQAKADGLKAKAKAHADASTNKDAKKGYADGERKLQQILDEQSSGVTDKLKMEFMAELEARIADPANAGKDLFTMIRDTVNGASVKDSTGKVDNKYLKKGDKIAADALKDAGPMARLLKADKVFDMLTDSAKADLKKGGVTKENFGQHLAENPSYDIKGNLDPDAHIDGYNDVAWWGLSSEGKASNVTELVDALALTPDSYAQGGVRFEITPEMAASAGVTKPTAFDGMFTEWAATGTENAFGVTGGGKREGVMGRIKVSDVGNVENFGGVPDQLVKARMENVGGRLKNLGDMDGVGLVDRINESGANNHQKSEMFEALQKAVEANPGKPAQELFNDLVNDPKYPDLKALKKPVASTGDGSGSDDTGVKPVETKPVETKPVETKPVETKPVETKPVETLTTEETSTKKGGGGKGGDEDALAKMRAGLRSEEARAEFDRIVKGRGPKARKALEGMESSQDGLEAQLKRSAARSAESATVKGPHGARAQEAAAMKPEVSGLLAEVKAKVEAGDLPKGGEKWLPKLQHELSLLEKIAAGKLEATPELVEGIRNNVDGLRAEIASGQGAGRVNAEITYGGGKTLDIDNISPDGKTWTEVKNKTPFGLQSSAWTDEVLPKAQKMKVAAKEHGVEKLRFDFPKGVSVEVATALEGMGFTVTGPRVGGR